MSESTNQDALNSLVGSDKSFKTVEDLAKGKVEADNFIKHLEVQVNTLTNELANAHAKLGTESVLEKIMSELRPNKPSNPEQITPPAETSKGNQPQALSQEDIVRLIEQREAAKQEERNYAEAYDVLKKVHGDKADEALALEAQRLGLSKEQLVDLAKQSPAAFINVLGLNKSNANRSTQGTVNSSAVNQGNTQSGVRNQAYYDGLKKEMGVAKFFADSALQLRLYKDQQSMGVDWFTQN